MRNDAGVRHTVTNGVLTLLNIARADPGRSNTNANSPGSRMRVRHLPHRQDVLGWPLLLVPRCSHPLASYTFYCSLSAPELLLRLFSRAKRFHWPLAFRFWSKKPASSMRTEYPRPGAYF